MNKSDTILTIMNIIAVIISPIVAVVIGQWLQEKNQKRKDKMEIFQCLMTHRATGWSHIECVNALNSIDIVFGDSGQVRQQWKLLLGKLMPGVPPQEFLREQCKLLEIMANDLGYQKIITWESIQNPYYPQWLVDAMERNSVISNGQIEWAKSAAKLSELLTNNSIGEPSKNAEHK